MIERSVWHRARLSAFLVVHASTKKRVEETAQHSDLRLRTLKKAVHRIDEAIVLWCTRDCNRWNDQRSWPWYRHWRCSLQSQRVRVLQRIAIRVEVWIQPTLEPDRVRLHVPTSDRVIVSKIVVAEPRLLVKVLFCTEN